MRSETGNPKKHKMNLILCTAAASLALTSCAADQNRIALLSAPPYFALSTGDSVPANATPSGFFAEEKGCVIFRPADDSPALTPVFPKGETQLVTDGTEWLGLYLKGQPVALQKVYRVSGARGYAGTVIPLAAPAPAGCPSSYFVVQNVGNMVADGNASRFCAGVTICRAFGMD